MKNIQFGFIADSLLPLRGALAAQATRQSTGVVTAATPEDAATAVRAIAPQSHRIEIRRPPGGACEAARFGMLEHAGFFRGATQA